MELNIEAEQNYLDADKELNNIYQAILSEYCDNSEFIENLKSSQRLWIKCRDAEVLVKYPKNDPVRQGSVFPLCYYLYLKELTTARTKTLKGWTEGVEEGEVCGGSCKIKILGNQ